METPWTIETGDHARIYGVKNSVNSSQKRAIFIVHGLTGHAYEYALKCAADYFEANYDVYRFNLYDGREGARSLTNCTISIHAQDLNAVLDTFGSNYEKVFLIGHSYGGPTIMKAAPDNIAAVSLWDPSYDLRRIQEEFKNFYLDHGKVYIVNWGTPYLIGKEMYEEAGSMTAEVCEKLARDFPSPVQVIHAGEGFYIKDPVSFHSFGNPQNRRDIVSGSEHCFYEGQSCIDLLQKTREWFSQF